MGGQGGWFLLLGKRQARECFSIIDSYKETRGPLSAAMLRGSVIQQQTAAFCVVKKRRKNPPLLPTRGARLKGPAGPLRNPGASKLSGRKLPRPTYGDRSSKFFDLGTVSSDPGLPHLCGGPLPQAAAWRKPPLPSLSLSPARMPDVVTPLPFFSTNRTQRKILNPSDLYSIPRPPSTPHLPHTLPKNKTPRPPTPHQKTPPQNKKAPPASLSGHRGSSYFSLGRTNPTMPFCQGAG